MAWSEGYFSEVEYPQCYFHDLSPLAIKLMMLAHGYQPPPSDRPLHYLELGFGQGLSFIIHATACEGEFWGNDFMPSLATCTQIMAETSGANATVLDDSFAELAARDDLPAFDIIVLHGIWNWISTENHRHILKIIESNLALGGVVYISYNTSPGKTSMLPVRDLMLLHMNAVSPKSDDISAKIKDALAFMQQLLMADAAYLSNTPDAKTRFKEDMLDETNLHYLAHEFFCAHWEITPFSSMASQLTSRGLTFCGQAKIRDFFGDSILPTQISTLLAGIKNSLFRESVRDFCINKAFRADLWLKGERRLSPLQRVERLAAMRFVITDTPPDEDPLPLMTSLGKLPLRKEMVFPLLVALADNKFEPKSINRLLEYSSLKHLNLPQACDMMLSLCGICVEPAHDEETIPLLKPRTDALNQYLINQARFDGRIPFLASPVTGGGVSVPRFHQLSLLAIRNGLATIDEVANFIWEIMVPLGQFVVTPKGVPCNGKSENLKELTLLVTSFFETRLPILTALKIS